MIEKLILLLGIEDICPPVSCRDCKYYQKNAFGNPCNEQRALADKLIRNGVTIPVRCKDCKHWNEETGWCDEHSHFYEHGMYWDVFAEEDYCSYGERKDNENNT